VRNFVSSKVDPQEIERTNEAKISRQKVSCSKNDLNGCQGDQIGRTFAQKSFGAKSTIIKSTPWIYFTKLHFGQKLFG
jgi:hypothetical protein